MAEPDRREPRLEGATRTADNWATVAAETETIVGRNEELAVIDRFLHGVAEGPATLAILGEPGIGKTTVWREATRRAEAQGTRALFNRSYVLALKGDVEEARETVAQLLEYAEAAGDDWSEHYGRAVEGVLELSLGRIGEARAALGRCVDILERLGAKEPLRIGADFGEALVLAGDLEQADEWLTDYERRTVQVDSAHEAANAARARALLTAARGDLDAAVAALEEAFRRHERVAIPLDVARTKLALGAVRRRRKERRLAREAFEEARRAFEQLGARVWAERARDELGRVGLRAAPDELTATERRVAELAATGMTNRKVAEAAFVSPKTVEANLSRVYSKLGIRSRAELGARIAALQNGPSESRE
jgi:DNA-binding NarL/FixJ family response regulator